MHLNWTQLLGGSLSGTLPQPGLSAEAFIQAQIFGAKQRAQVALDDSQIVQIGQVFGKHAPVLIQPLANDSQAVQVDRIFSRYVPPASLPPCFATYFT